MGKQRLLWGRERVLRESEGDPHTEYFLSVKEHLHEDTLKGNKASFILAYRAGRIIR